MNIFIIAEIGINHNGDIKIAKKLIDYSSEAGFDAVKFQKRNVEKVYSKDYLDSFRESPWGKTQRDQKMGLEFSKKEYEEIDSYCKEKKIKWTASAWDLESQDFISSFNVSFNKLASPMLGHKPLVRKIALEGKKTFISTGMTTIDEIDDVVNLFKSEKCPFELMHCNSTYPMPENEANLLCIQTLKKKFDCNVGYSGHESTLLKVCLTAVALGATSIERHITLDRAMYGSDQSASLELKGMKELITNIEKYKTALGEEKLGSVLEEEKTIAKKLRAHIKK